jgi:hypothetical protein
MKLKSTYEFISGFREVVRLDIFHDYFNDSRLTNFEIGIAAETVSLLKNYGLLLKSRDNSIVLLSDVNERFKTTSFNGEIVLKIQLFPKDKFFFKLHKSPT